MDRFRAAVPALFLAAALTLAPVVLAGCGAPDSAAPPATEAPPAEPEYPRFPWPPPQASATELIPAALLAPPVTQPTLGDVDLRLTAALDRAGYTESSYYAIPGGYARVTRMEQIERDGTPKKDPDRWVLDLEPLREFSLAAYLAALFTARPGFYRIIVFTLTPVTFKQAMQKVTMDEATDWLSGGLNRLPPRLGQTGFGADFACTALIYEFERPSETEAARQRVPGQIPGRAHLQKAGILDALAP